MKILKKLLFFFICILFLISLLTYPTEGFMLSSSGLMAWFERMLPTLFPFLVLTNILIGTGFHIYLARFFFILRYIYKINSRLIYVIVMGFLCGFPMGAKCISLLYSRNELTKDEADFLLSFCNNLGPIYFLSFIIPLSGIQSPWGCLFGMYGIPLLYGLFLRFTFYRKRLSPSERVLSLSVEKKPSFSVIFDYAISDSLRQITALGGYMVVFSTLPIMLTLLTSFFSSFSFYLSPLISGVISSLCEITSGVLILFSFVGSYKTSLLYPILFTTLSFGGLSCIAQTKNVLSNTDLSCTKYIIHKIILSALVFPYYCLLFKH